MRPESAKTAGGMPLSSPKESTYSTRSILQLQQAVPFPAFPALRRNSSGSMYSYELPATAGEREGPNHDHHRSSSFSSTHNSRRRKDPSDRDDVSSQI